MPDEADLSSPGGPGGVVDLLGDAECWRLLASGGLGRLVYSSRYGPTALPVV